MSEISVPEKILIILSDNTLNSKQIAKQTGLDVGVVRNTLWRLRKNNLVFVKGKNFSKRSYYYQRKDERAKHLIGELVSLFDKWALPKLTDLVLETILFLLDTEPTESVREIILKKQRLKNEVEVNGIYR